MADDYILCARGVSGGKFTNEPGPVRYLRVKPEATTYAAGDEITPRADWAAQVQGLADGDENPLSISPTGDVLVFVHGFNNTIEAVLSRLRLLRATLAAEGWRGAVVAFDWPSGNQVLGYAEDRSDASKTALTLVSGGIALLAGRQRRGCQTNVHLLAHSTGAYVVMQAFAQAQQDGALFKGDWRVGQVAFISADIAQSSLAADSDWAAPMWGRIMRLTNYSNGHDAVLAVSNAKRLGVAPRAGRVGLPDDAAPKAVNVDCTAFFETVPPEAGTAELAFTHSWQFGNAVFARDLAMTLEGASDRNAIPTRQAGPRGLVLRDAPRPGFQQRWGIGAAAKLDATRVS
jgi:esterase/lipase superfamily enzyme